MGMGSESFLEQAVTMAEEARGLFKEALALDPYNAIALSGTA